ncbi:MAG: NUDIX hydrolase [Thiothrix sp.]|jgi:8-oxo-dGTP pyrophosphatase MutT (NUDIX family)|nr:MAG: NUDIX hydrolase [Thiothrix sp.]
MVWKPRVVVASVIEQEGRFLLVEEVINGVQVINQPAGHLEHGESLIDAVKRETLEETGYRFEPTALLGVLMLNSDDPERVYLRFTFTGTIIEQIAGYQTDPDIIATHWLSPEEILVHPRLSPRSDLVFQAIDLYNSGQRLPLESLVFTR